MNLETRILAAAYQDRDACLVIDKLLTEQELGVHGQVLLKYANAFYEADESADSVDVDIIKSKLGRENPKHADQFYTILDSFSHVSVPNVIDDIAAHKKQQIGLRLSAALLDGVSDNVVAELMDEYKSCDVNSIAEESKYEIRHGTGVSEFIEANRTENLIRVYPRGLWERLDGGVPRGSNNNFLVFGETETGKTAFAINMGYGFAHQGLKVLYIGNEDADEKYSYRVLSRFSGLTKQEIMQDHDTALRRAVDTGYNNFYFVGLAPGTLVDVRALLDEIEPDVLIVDQMRKILYPKSKGETEQITHVSSEIRNIGKERGIITVNVTQASNSAKNKLILHYDDVYMSNTSVPGDMDVMIGLGIDDNFRNNGQLMVSLPKNKVSGNHTFFPVIINPFLSKITSMD